MGWEHYQTVDPLKKEPQVRTGLFGVRLLILYLKFQFSKPMKSSKFHIFLNLTYPLRKNISFTKCPKITQKFTQNHKTLVNVLSGGIWRCLKRKRDIGTKATLSGENSLQVKSRLKLHLTPIFLFAKTALLVIWNTSAKCFLIRINPRFSVPRRILENTTIFVARPSLRRMGPAGVVTSPVLSFLWGWCNT